MPPFDAELKRGGQIFLAGEPDRSAEHGPRGWRRGAAGREADRWPAGQLHQAGEASARFLSGLYRVTHHRQTAL